MSARQLKLCFLVGLIAIGCSRAEQPTPASAELASSPAPAQPAAEAQPAKPAPAAQPQPVAVPAAVESYATVRKHKLTLRSLGDTCEVVAAAAGQDVRLPVELKGPCRFVQSSAEAARVESYADLKAKVLLIMGDPKVIERNGKLLCDGSASTGLQAVLVRESSVSLGVPVRNFSPLCPDSEMDEKDFWLCSHPG